MSRQAAPQPSLVKREEKDDKLSSLLLRYTETMSRNAAADPTAATCLLVARSAESPVARMVLSLGAGARLRGFSVRAIFAFLGTAETVRIAEACRASGWALQVRWARDLRLLEAHEQLVLGAATSWIGDSMRRDPLSHDACELHAPDCPDSAERAALFFERLWQVSEAVLERQAPATEAERNAEFMSQLGQLAPGSSIRLGPRPPHDPGAA